MKKAIVLLTIPVLMAFVPGELGTPPIFDHRSVESALRLIPAGQYNHGPLDTDNPFHKSQPLGSEIVEVGEFFISDHEVTNGEYLLFVEAMRLAAPEVWQSLLPDTMVWKNPMAYMEPYIDLYLRHPEYRNFPVVGVTYEQATAYCAWLTEQYRTSPKCKYANARFRLPTEVEWCYAASGGLALQSLPWGGNNLMNAKGEWMANFKPVSQTSIGRMRMEGGESELFVAGETGMGSVMGSSVVRMPMAVRSFSPNGFGVYDMAGNVEEFVMEKGIVKGGSWNDPGFYLQI